MSYSKISLAGTVGSVPKTLTIKEDLTYTAFDLFTGGSYPGKSGEAVEYHERHRITCVGTLDILARSIKMGARIVVEGELRSLRQTLDLNSRVDIQITYRVWEVVANSIRQDDNYPTANSEREVAAALIARYYWPDES
jgi:single-stranded DNA-binding protein